SRWQQSSRSGIEERPRPGGIGTTGSGNRGLAARDATLPQVERSHAGPRPVTEIGSSYDGSSEAAVNEHGLSTGWLSAWFYAAGFTQNDACDDAGGGAGRGDGLPGYCAPCACARLRWHEPAHPGPKPLPDLSASTA